MNIVAPKNSIQSSDFTFTVIKQDAKDFGLEYFPNGYNCQEVYTLKYKGAFVKQHISGGLYAGMKKSAWIDVLSSVNENEELMYSEYIYFTTQDKKPRKVVGRGVKVTCN